MSNSSQLPGKYRGSHWENVGESFRSAGGAVKMSV
jgi:hypothetical protein